MKNINKQKAEIERLIKFAEHLNTIRNFPGELLQEVELVDMNKKVRTHYLIRYNYFIIDELPAVFEEFGFDAITGDPMLEGRSSEEEGPTLSVLEFFGLGAPAEFAHLFDMEGLQDTKIYGGRVLTPESTPKDIAFNMMQFVRFKKFENQPRLGK
jgi:hypothetical protein